MKALKGESAASAGLVRGWSHVREGLLDWASQPPVRAVLASPWPALVLYVAFITGIGPWWSVPELWVDEGFNLQKAALVAEGFLPYREIWSDQPPVLTYALAAFEFAGVGSVALARAFILGLACLLLAALFRLTQHTFGLLAAWLAVLLLAGSPSFQLLSVTVLIGLPAIALATFALERCVCSRGAGWLAVSGVLFGLAVQTKFFVAPWAIAFMAAILVPGLRDKGTARGRVVNLAIWCGASAATFLLVMTLSGEALIAQLVSPHLEPVTRAFQLFQSLLRLYGMVNADQVFFAGVAGGAVLAWQQQRQAIIPILISAVPLVLLANHAPIAMHHGLLSYVGLAWLGGAGVAWLFKWASGPRANVHVAALPVILCVAVGALIAPKWHRTFKKLHEEQADFVAMAEAFRAHYQRGDWVVTDRPLVAYRVGALNPPSLAVFSTKRIQTGNLPPRVLIAEIERWKPTTVMLNRFKVEPTVQAYLRRHYVEIPDPRWRHFVRPDRIADRSG